MEAPQDTNGTFGTSEYGERLVYKKEGCCVGWRDKGWAIFYYIHVLFIIFLCIYLPANLESQGLSFDTLTTIFAGGSGDILSALMGKIIGILIIQCVVGAIFGILWLKVLQKFPAPIIKIMLFVLPVLFILLAVAGFAQGNNGTGLVVIGILFCLLSLWYAYCVWNKIPFSAALLKIASEITQTFEGTICISLSVIPLNIIWAIMFNWIWLCVFIGYIFRFFAVGQATPTVGEIIFVFFLLSISWFWSLQVFRNVSHTASCGVAATWYFSKEVHKPSMPALKRTMTTSFGSVCFGSFIVAVLQAIRSTLRAFGSRGPCWCILYCFLVCIEKLVRYFNLYAFAQCAIYGSSFLTSAKATYSLFVAKGFKAVINDSITELPLFGGGMVAFIICFFIGFGLTPAFFSEPMWTYSLGYIQYYMSVYGGLFGYFACYSIFFVVRSSIVTLFVCFAEAPDSLKENRPEQYAELINTKDVLNTYVQLGHTGLGEDGKPISNQQQQPQQQQQQPQQTQQTQGPN